MKVLLSTDTVGGVWDYTATLASALDADGHDVLVAVLGELPDARAARLPDAAAVECRDLRLAWMPDAAGDVSAAADWLRGLASRWGADVAHLNQMEYTAEGFPAPTLVVAHSDVLSWFSEARGHPAPAEWRRYQRQVESGLRGADAVAAPSAYQSALIERHYGRGADHVIHNGVAHHQTTEPAAERAPSPRPSSGPTAARNHGSSAPVALIAGRAWDEAKGAATVEEALELLGDRAPRTHLLGALEGPNGERFTPRRLHSHGRLLNGEVDRWMRRADIYIGSSVYEPFGLAPLEAAAHGCALVLSDVGSFRELWSGCAEFFSAGDAGDLARALAAVADDPSRRETLAHAAQRRARTRYTAERMAGEYLRLYHAMTAATSNTTPTLGTGACV